MITDANREFQLVQKNGQNIWRSQFWQQVRSTTPSDTPRASDSFILDGFVTIEKFLLTYLHLIGKAWDLRSFRLWV